MGITLLGRARVSAHRQLGRFRRQLQTRLFGDPSHQTLLDLLLRFAGRSGLSVRGGRRTLGIDRIFRKRQIGRVVRGQLLVDPTHEVLGNRIRNADGLFNGLPGLANCGPVLARYRRRSV
jgi:hypothetical protein